MQQTRVVNDSIASKYLQSALVERANRKYSKRLEQLSAIFSPTFAGDYSHMPKGPNNDMRCRIQIQDTSATLSAGTTGDGLILIYYGAPFKKVLEHYVNVGGYWVLDKIIEGAIDLTTDYTWGRIIKNVLELKSGFQLATTSNISAGTNGAFNGALVPDGISQLYKSGLTSANAINYNTISQLTQNRDTKLIGPVASEGIALIPPPNLEQPFVRLGDKTEGNSATNRNENIDWNASNIITGDVQFPDIIGTSITIPVGATYTLESETQAVDIPFHAEFGANLALDFSALTGQSSGPLFVTVYAQLYDVGRNLVSYGFSVMAITYTTSGPKQVQMDGRKVWPDTDEQEVHPTITAVKWRISFTNSSTSNATMTLSRCWLDTKITIPLYPYPGFAQRCALIAYANFSEGAPIMVSSQIVYEAAPNAKFAQKSDARERLCSETLEKLINKTLKGIKKAGLPCWYKTMANIDPSGKFAYEEHLKAIMMAVVVGHYGDEDEIGKYLDSLHDTRLLPNPGSVPQPMEFSSGFKNFLNKFIHKVSSEGYRKVLKPALQEGIQLVSKPVVDELSRVIANRPAASFSSGAAFSSKPKPMYFSSRNPLFTLHASRDLKKSEKVNLRKTVENFERNFLSEMIPNQSVMYTFDSPSYKYGNGETYAVKKDFTVPLVSEDTTEKVEKRVKTRKDDLASGLYEIDEFTKGVFVPAKSCNGSWSKDDGTLFYFTPANVVTRQIVEPTPQDSYIGRFRIHGHSGTALSVPVSSDWVLLEVLKVNGKMYGKKYANSCSGDSIQFAMAIAPCIDRRFMLAVTGAVEGRNVKPLDPLTSLVKKKCCEWFGIPMCANSPLADIEVKTVQDLRDAFKMLTSLKHNGAHCMPQNRPGNRNQSNTQPSSNQPVSQKKMGNRAPKPGPKATAKSLQNRQNNSNNERIRNDYNSDMKNNKDNARFATQYGRSFVARGADDFVKNIFFIANGKTAPYGKFYPVPFVYDGTTLKPQNVIKEKFLEDWTQILSRLWSKLNVELEQLSFLQEYEIDTENPAITVNKAAVQLFLSSLLEAELYVHSGFGFKNSTHNLGKLVEWMKKEVRANVSTE
jgi:hypothetical protein